MLLNHSGSRFKGVHKIFGLQLKIEDKRLSRELSSGDAGRLHLGKKHLPEWNLSNPPRRKRISYIRRKSASAKRLVFARPGPTMSGICSTNSVGISGNTGAQIKVAVPPTQMALTLIPRSASSKATDFVKPRTPSFAAVYACVP